MSPSDSLASPGSQLTPPTAPQTPWSQALRLHPPLPNRLLRRRALLHPYPLAMVRPHHVTSRETARPGRLLRDQQHRADQGNSPR
jgi:hypothetical protein